VTSLRKGRIENPGYDKMLAIARAMGFPPEAWFEETPSGPSPAVPGEGLDIAGRVVHLFDAVRNPTTGELYTNAEVARTMLGELSHGDVEGIRTGTISDPTVGQVAALAAVFGVPASYLVDQGEDSSVLDEGTLEALANEIAGAILRESARLPNVCANLACVLTTRSFGRGFTPSQNSS
jgi:hypothetical protein